MPHASIKTIRNLIYWEYAKLIAGSAVRDRKNYAFIVYTYTRLRNQQIHPSAILRENQLLVGEYSDRCAYCEKQIGDMQWEHIIPLSRGGPDTIDNQVLSCQSCNLSKSGRDPYEWYGEEKKYDIPRVVWGKYLKIVYEIHKEKGSLESHCTKTSDICCY